MCLLCGGIIEGSICLLAVGASHILGKKLKEKKDENKEKYLQYPRKGSKSLQRAKPRSKNRDC